MMSCLRQPTPWALAAFSLSFLTIAAARPGQGKSATLAGTWKLNVEKMTEERKGQPDDPKTKQGYGSGGRPRVGTGFTDPRGAGGGGGGGGMGGGRTGGGGGEPGEAGGGGGRGNLGPLVIYARPLPQLVIVQTDSTITISDPSGHPRTYHLDGRKEIEPLPGSDTLEIVARYKGGKLTTERKMGSLGSVREVYSIDSGTGELIVEVRLFTPQLSQPMDMRRIYDGAGGS